MRAWFRTVWSALRDSLWFVPAAMTLVSVVLAVVLMTVEWRGLLWTGQAPWWVYQGDAQGARTVLNAVTGSLITVTGVIFTLTIVAVQLASSQYTPRVLRNFSSDRGNQMVLGVFIGTFTFASLVLRTVRGPGGVGDEFIPRLAVTVGMTLLIACVAALIYFINHIARELHVTAIVDRITADTMRNVHQLFPEHIGGGDESPPPDPREPGHPSVTVCARQAGYVQIVDQKRLFKLGSRERLVIGMEPKIGDYVLQGRPLASVWADRPLDEELERDIQKTFVLGPERTPDQDVEFGMIQISDIAIKGLSPSINDPTTALRCIDRLAELLTEFSTRATPEPHRTRDGRVHFVATYTTFEVAVKVAFDDIRHFGAGIPLVAQHLIEILTDLLVLVPAGCREPLVGQARAVLHTAREQISNPRDLTAVEEAAQRLAERTGFDMSEKAHEAAAEDGTEVDAAGDEENR